VQQSATNTRARYRGVPRPNIVLINTDDQAPHMLDFMPTALNEIAAKGVTFASSFATTPICAPSRASLLSGNYAHTHGVLNVGGANGGAARFVGPDLETLAVWLQRTGYRTGHFGKYINGYQLLCDDSSCYVPPGWDVWRAFPLDHYYNYLLSVDGPKVAYGNAPADYSTDVLRDQALAFLDAHPGEPVFLYFSAYAPHVETPNLIPVPAPRHLNLFAGVVPWRPPSYMEADVSDKPAWVQALPVVVAPILVGFIDGSRQLGLEALLATDEAIAAILDKLAAQGRLADTVVVFTSDNGYTFGEHRTFGKQHPYEEAIRIPLSIRYDRLLRERGAVRSDLALNIDLAPTLAEWAQVPSALRPPVDGLSLTRAAAGSEALARDAVLIEQWQPRRFAGVRTQEWKYVRHQTGERELYDLANDPAELVNVASLQPALADQLEQRILDLGGTLPDP
jgi:arylsulfatase A-like enzyme